jgi:hypothetical protein
LPDEAFHLLFKKRSENVARVQAGVFHDVVNWFRLIGAELRVDLLAAAGKRGGDEQAALLEFGCSGLVQAARTGNQLGSLLDQEPRY